MPGRPLSPVLPALLLACALGAHAQEPWRFQQVSTADGLSDDAITCLHQDRAGFLWIGTENGLDRYDGHHVRTWRREDGLSGDQISAVIEDRAGIIWAATRDGGLTRLDPISGMIRAFRHDERSPLSIATDRLTCLFDLNDTTLMIGAEQVPIMFLDKRTLTFQYWNGSGPIAPALGVARPILSGEWCHTIVPIDAERMTIGFLHMHMRLIVDRRTGMTLDTALAPVPGDETVTALTHLEDRLYGVGWQRSLAVRDLDEDQANTRSIPLPDEGTALLTLDREHVLVGTRASGLCTVDVRNGDLRLQKHQRSDHRTIADDRIRCLLRDQAGRIWVGTQHGLSVHDPTMESLTSIPLYPASAYDQPDLIAFRIDGTAHGEPVVCTSDGLFVLHTNGEVEHRSPRDDSSHPLRTTGLFHTKAGTFIGAEEGVERYDEESNAVHHWAHGMTVDKTGAMTDLFQVRSLFLDTLAGHASLLLGVLGYGVAWLDLANETVQLFVQEPKVPRSLGNNLTHQVLRTRDGRYWVATASGLYRWELDRAHPSNAFDAFRSDSSLHSLAGNDVQALVDDRAGRLFVATRDGGLCMITNDVVERLPCPRPLGNSTLGLTLDALGRVWCTTADGLEVFDPRMHSFTHVPVDGMGGPAALSGCIATLSDGRIGLVAENTLFLIDPERTLQLPEIPKPYLTGLDMLGHDVLARLKNGQLSLGTDERMLTISLSALQLAAPGHTSFAVRLEGLDPTTRITDAQGRISYTGLPAGSYELFARTVDGHGRMGAEVLLVAVRVAAPFWQRWWFFVLIAATAGGIVWLWSWYRIKQALKLHAVRDRIASDLHDEVGSSLSAITIGSELAVQLSKEENEQVRQLMQRIGSTSSESLRSISDIVWAIDPKNDEGEALVKRMRRIAHDLLERQGVRVDLVVGPGIEDLKLLMDARKDLLLICKEAVHNASKHAGARTVRIVLERVGHALHLHVQDDGRGFDPSLHPDGHGLSSMQRRGKALGSTVLIESAPGKGTRVSVRVDLASIRD